MILLAPQHTTYFSNILNWSMPHTHAVMQTNDVHIGLNKILVDLIQQFLTVGEHNMFLYSFCNKSFIILKRIFSNLLYIHFPSK